MAEKSWLATQVKQAQVTVSQWPEWIKSTAQFEGSSGLRNENDEPAVDFGSESPWTKRHTKASVKAVHSDD